MSTTTIVKCDICQGQENVKSNCETPVVFLTEQTEGRSTKPYLAKASLDLCESCISTLIEFAPLQATGAQGHNTYYWNNKVIRGVFEKVDSITNE